MTDDENNDDGNGPADRDNGANNNGSRDHDDTPDYSAGWREVEDAMDVPRTDAIVSGEPDGETDDERILPDRVVKSYTFEHEEIDRLERDLKTAAEYARRLDEHYNDTGEYYILQVQDSLVEPVVLFQDNGPSYIHEDYSPYGSDDNDGETQEQFSIEDPDALEQVIQSILGADVQDDADLSNGAPALYPTEAIFHYTPDGEEKQFMYFGHESSIPDGVYREFGEFYLKELRDIGSFSEDTMLDGAFIAGGMQDHYTPE